MIFTRIGSFFKEVGISWRESLKLLMDKRFWLVTLKASKETYTELFKGFWWLICVCIVVDVVTRMHLLPIFSGALLVVWFLLWSLVACILFLMVRSSLDIKDCWYYASYWNSYCWFVFVTAAVWALRFYSMNSTIINKFLGWFFDGVDYLLFIRNFPGLSTVYFSPFLIVYTFFYLDSSKKIRYFLTRLWSACCAVFYTYPFCLIVWFIISLAAFLLEFIIINSIVSMLGWLYFEKHADSYHLLEIIADNATKLIIPFIFCLFYTLYTKQVHDHYDRYAL